MQGTTTVSPPEQGQLVDIRHRRYVVADVAKGAVPPSGLGPYFEPQHLVTLVSVEDDALGEELQVIWELEPGARVHEKMALPTPTGFDEPARLDAFLDAVRWGAASTADVRSLQAPFRSGIDIEDYQLDPVVRAIQMARANLLIADDVGLGKTIEAGLVIQELIVRHRARTVLVVCPSSLQIQWRDQMRDKFGLEFRIVDTDLMKHLRRSRGLHVNPWNHFPRLITSIDYLKRDRPLRLMREILSDGQTYPRKFDILVVDEAHNVAPSGRGKYATDSMRTAAIRLITPHFEHKLFLTATPHNGYQESFTALLELLDSQRFARGVEPDRRQLNAVMVRRLKSELPPHWDGSRRFPERKLKAMEVTYTEAEKQAHRWLRKYTKLRLDNAQDHTEQYATTFVLKLLKKRLFSSPQAFKLTLEQHVKTLRRAKPDRTRKARPTMSVLQRQVSKMEEDFADDDVFEESTDDAVATATRTFGQLTADEEDLLRKMQEWAASASARPDSKTAELIRWLHETVKPNGKWSDRRVIIFTEYRATQKWLMEILASGGLTSGNRVMMLYGGMDSDKRETIKAAFQARPDQSPVRILLATDAASEGIDLQNHCSRLVHFEIPWNPNRLEQRNGRIDRHGQKADEVLVYHFVSEGYREHSNEPFTKVDDLEAGLEFLMRAAIKINTIREDLGKVGPVIAQQVEEAMLGMRTRLDTSRAEHEAQPIREMLKFDRDLREQIRKLYDQLRECRDELHLSPENIQSVAQIGLQLAGQAPLQETEVEGIWPDPAGKRTRCPVFTLPALRGSWAACAEGLEHPHTREVRPIVFDHDLAAGRDDVVLVHLNHRLVQMCLRLLRAEVWADAGRKRLHRVAARIVPNPALDTPAVVAHARLVLISADSQRLHEQIITAGGRIREGRFSRMNVGEVQNALNAALPDEPTNEVKQRLAGLWPKLEDSLRLALEARMHDRTGGLQKALAERAEKEASDITTILNELRDSILAQLTEEKERQLVLPTMEEKDQRQRDLNSLRARVEHIPAEIKKEVEAIHKRFADPQPRLFPVAVTFLVPKKLAGG